MSSQRLQKVLAQAGIASRRSAEELITAGRVRVNGRIVRELGARADPNRDRVEVDGKRLVAERPVYFLMHKPRGVVTTLDDPEGRKTVKDLLHSVNERVFPVGRLDFQTSGALLLTNDGALAQALLHPTRAVPKTYNAKLEGQLDQARLELLRAGVVLDDGHKTAPAEVKVLRTDPKHTSVEITIAEGKNRQIHRMGDAVGRAVLRLTRISFAGLTVDGLRPGQLRPLSALELADLKQKYVNRPKRPRRVDMVILSAEPEQDADFGVVERPRSPEPRPLRKPGVRKPVRTTSGRAARVERSGTERTARGPRQDKTRKPDKTRAAKRQPAKSAKRGAATRVKRGFSR
jgi:23S rRNA pseudouridine2605 synthase